MRGRKTSIRRKRDARPPAGCLKSDGLSAGDENSLAFLAPEEKAADTKGLPLIGRISLDQFTVLVSNGYDGEVVRRWTRYHADQEIRRKNLTRRRIRRYG